MRKIISTMWISIDGYIAGPKGEMNWVIVDEEMGKYENDLVTGADTLMFGRTTYQSFAGSWPSVPDNPSVPEAMKDYARKLNNMRKIVFSKTLDKLDWNNSTLMKEIVPKEIEKLKQERGRDIVMYGSASIVQAFTKFDLIDEYQLLIHPVLLGSGKELFKDINEKRKLKLVTTKIFASGVVGLYYQPNKSS